MKRLTPARISLALVTLTSLGCVLVTKEGGELVDDSSTGSPDVTTTSYDGSSDDQAYEESGIVPGCIGDSDCGDPDLVCIDGACVPNSGPLTCNPAYSPTCGDGIIEAMEECDGGPDCEPNCLGWWDGGGTQPLFRLVDASPNPAGALDVIAIDPGTGSVVVGPANDGGGVDSFTVLDAWISDPRAVATDPLGNTYAVGGLVTETGSDGALVSLDATGALRWQKSDFAVDITTDVATDGNIVVVSGGSQDGSSPEGILWIFDTDGNLLGSVAATNDTSSVTAVAISGGDIFGIVQGPGTSRITRWDASGSTLLDLYATSADEPLATLHAIAPDGAGGVWVGGEAAGGPLLQHVVPSGPAPDAVEVSSRGCFGGRNGSIQTLAMSPNGRLGMGLRVTTDTGIETPWFAVLTDDTIEFARQPGTTPDSPGNIPVGTPAFVTWWSDGSFIAAHVDEGWAGTVWEILFVP